MRNVFISDHCNICYKSSPLTVWYLYLEIYTRFKFTVQPNLEVDLFHSILFTKFLKCLLIKLIFVFKVIVFYF
jgi:hypothetical protein